jgi:hypothetical protein
VGLSGYERKAAQRAAVVTHMKYITEEHMTGMLSGLCKEAGGVMSKAIPVAKNLLQSHLGTRTSQMMAGGVAGAALGAGTGEEGTRFQRGLLGGMAGASAVGLGHLATKSGREAAGTGVKNFWERSKYQFTGKGLEGNHGARVQRARDIGLIPKLDKKPSSKALVQDAAQQEALKNDWLSLPGSLHGLVTKPGAVLKNSWNRMDMLGKGLTGAAGVSVGSDLIQKPDPNGPGRLEKALGNAAGTVGFTAGPAGMLPSMLMGGWAGKAGQRVGRVGDRLAGHAPVQPVEENLAQAYPEASGAV